MDNPSSRNIIDTNGFSKGETVCCPATKREIEGQARSSRVQWTASLYVV